MASLAQLIPGLLSVQILDPHEDESERSHKRHDEMPILSPSLHTSQFSGEPGPEDPRAIPGSSLHGAKVDGLPS
jgi:hypothetical protein